MSLNTEQSAIISDIRDFLVTDDHDTFILKGYAGTGKTFLMQYLAKELSEEKKLFSLLATTGRAATVLKGKTGLEARTIHGELYQFYEVDGDDDSIPDNANVDLFGQMKLIFNLRPKDESKRVYIVDEASMVSTETNADISYAEFGTGNLLADLLTVVDDNKVIFVGDPCQLPPVGQSISPALDGEHFIEYNRKVQAAELTTIVRTSSDNDILVLAHAVRDMVGSTSLPAWPKLPALNRNNVSVHPSEQDLLNGYLEKFSSDRMSCIAIAQSNSMCNKINEAVRAHIYKRQFAPLQVGDILMVTQNNYLVPLTNGDFVEVVAIDNLRHEANLQFLSIRVKHLLTDKEHEILLALDVLFSGRSSLSKEQQRMLMVNFSNRVRSKGIRPNTPEYRESMKQDPFLNSLRATFGYAVTCHKSQGGEWPEVFLFLHKGMYGMERNDMFRWWYTAITRAKERLHLGSNWWVV